MTKIPSQKTCYTWSWSSESLPLRKESKIGVWEGTKIQKNVRTPTTTTSPKRIAMHLQFVLQYASNEKNKKNFWCPCALRKQKYCQ